MGGRGASFKSNSLPNKTIMTDTSKYSGYAKELADTVKGDEVYQIKHNGGEAFADVYVDSAGDLRIDYIGSTGKGAGSELMARLAEKALSEGRNLSWIADNSGAKSYYSHLGLTRSSTFDGTWLYSVSPDKLSNLIKRLRKE